VPKSKLGKALGYLFNQRPQLEIFLEDPRIEIHNNDAERDLRHVVVGRNNWLAFASPRGGEVASRLYSLVLSCKHAGVDPEAYRGRPRPRLDDARQRDRLAHALGLGREGRSSERPLRPLHFVRRQFQVAAVRGPPDAYGPSAGLD